MAIPSLILINDDIISMYEYYKQIGNNIMSEKYKKLCIYATNCPIMFDYAKEYVNGKSNAFFTDISDAYFTMAYYYYFSRICQVDDAVKYFELSHEKGNDCASYNLSVYYENRNDKLNQHKYLISAIENGNIIAIGKFVILNNISYFNDLLHPKIDQLVFNLTKDICWHIGCYFENKNYTNNMLLFFKLASDKNHEEATIKLAKYYQSRNNRHDMIKYYKQLADVHGNVESMKELTKYYKEKGYYNQMETYYKKLAKLGDVNAHYNLACHYKIKKCEKKMIEYFEKASKLGHYFSQFELEQYYIEHICSDKLFELYTTDKFNSTTQTFELFMALHVYNKKDDEEDFLCPITLVNCKNGFKTNCGHTFSHDLLFIKSNCCPICRNVLV